MKIYKVENGIVISNNENLFFSANADWDGFINRDNLPEILAAELKSIKPLTDQEFQQMKILAPIGQQEVWAAGVTYLRSRDARMEESKAAGGGNFYDKVYEADRPELFFKATAHRVAGTNDNVRIRKDSKWDVPEPELTLFITSTGKITGYTVGNDMSSRSIEGENPLYLPQAKTYDKSAAIGPCIYVPGKPLPPETKISLEIKRNEVMMFSSSIAISQIKRKLEELAAYLFRECSFPYGCFLMTGTGIVPPNDFTLQSADEISIAIDGIGVLRNVVE
ncbi:MAG: fumarylacetoacetate hydrolase family protein [Chitinophagaceae bacterium]|nr:fumarylacetoacetate hydrolase family protein [Chitinophagaceae bacterium]